MKQREQEETKNLKRMSSKKPGEKAPRLAREEVEKKERQNSVPSAAKAKARKDTENTSMNKDVDMAKGKKDETEAARLAAEKEKEQKEAAERLAARKKKDDEEAARLALEKKEQEKEEQARKDKAEAEAKEKKDQTEAAQLAAEKEKDQVEATLAAETEEANTGRFFEEKKPHIQAEVHDTSNQQHQQHLARMSELERKKQAARLLLEKAQKELEDAEKEESMAVASFEDTLVVETFDKMAPSVNAEVAETQVDSPPSSWRSFHILISTLKFKCYNSNSLNPALAAHAMLLHFMPNPCQSTHAIVRKIITNACECH